MQTQYAHGPLWAAETGALSIEDVSPLFVGSLTCVQKGVLFFRVHLKQVGLNIWATEVHSICKFVLGPKPKSNLYPNKFDAHEASSY